jgi:hypothetical protein
LNRSGLVQQCFVRRTLPNRSSEAIHFSRNMAIDTSDIEDQEQRKGYDITGITQNKLVLFHHTTEYFIPRSG